MSGAIPLFPYLSSWSGQGQLYVLTLFTKKQVKTYKSVDTAEEVNEAMPPRRAGMSGGRTETFGLYLAQTAQPAHAVYSCLLCWRSAELRSGD